MILSTLAIHAESPVPIYEQIVDRVTFAIAAGDLEAGDLVPSVREVAQQLTINPNTVARAFQELERRGIVAAKRGLGMVVTQKAPEACRSRRHDRIRTRIREALREAVTSGLSAEAVRQLVEEELARSNGHRHTREKQ